VSPCAAAAASEVCHMMCCDSVAAADRTWYSDDEDENADQKTAQDLKTDTQNPTVTAVNHHTDVLCLLVTYWKISR